MQKILMDQKEKTFFAKYTCPFCQKEIRLNGNRNGNGNGNQNKNGNGNGLMAILNIHGEPIHALILYVDSHMNVRSHSVIENIEVSRDSDTLKQLLNAWSKVS